MNTTDRINKIQELLREVSMEFELLKQDLGGDLPENFEEKNLGVLCQMKDIASFFNNKQQLRDIV